MSKNYNFGSWTPSQEGTYTIEVTTQTPDCKCANRLQDVMTKTIIINKVNHAPIAYNLNVNTIINTPIAFNLNCIDLDGNNLTYGKITNTAYGFLSINNITGSSFYVPQTNFLGQDSFSYICFDGISFSNPATVQINVSLNQNMTNCTPNWQIDQTVCTVNNQSFIYFIDLNNCNITRFPEFNGTCIFNETNQTCIDNDNDTYYLNNGLCNSPRIDCNDNNSAVHPGAIEICNGIDDNCNGQIDESLTRQCGINNTGICTFGLETCNIGNWQGCSAVFPINELCNNQLDDNCNGQTDESCQACIDADDDTYYAISVQCPQGNDCNDNNFNIHPNAQEICNGIDDNCNGQIDEGEVCNICNPNQTQNRQCGVSNIGICTFGIETRTCQSNGQWGSYNGCNAIFPINEICNGIDENCNGIIDDNCVPINFTVQINANPLTGETPLTVNFGSTVIGGITPYSYYWEIIGGPIITSPTFQYTFFTNGTYPVHLTVTDAFGNQASDSVLVNVNGPNRNDDGEEHTSNWIYIPDLVVDNTDLKDGNYLKITFKVQNSGDKTLNDVSVTLSIPELGAHTNVKIAKLKKDKSDTRTVYLYLPVKPYSKYHFLRLSADAQSGTVKRTVYREIKFR